MTMSKRKELFIRCGSIVLEAVLEIPEETTGGLAAAVICHPHPQYGGTMFNNVTRALKRAFYDRGMICLRFNFRGTGRSEGTYGEGIAEREDVRAALDYVVSLEEVDPEKLVIAGYSFGCWVALAAAADDPRPARLVGISPPVDAYDFGFLNREARPKFLIAGDRDFVCSVERFQRLLDEIPEPKKGIVLRGVDHFHVGREDTLIEEVHGFLDAYPFARCQSRPR